MYSCMLVAIQLVLSRVLVIDLGVYRITLGCRHCVGRSLDGTCSGGVGGAVADIIGCFMKGLGVITDHFISVAWGVIPGWRKLMLKEKKSKDCCYVCRNCNLW